MDRRIASLPRRAIVIDVETTGLTRDDRVVTLGAVAIDRDRLLGGERTFDFLHLVFNPDRRSHPMARAVHGYGDAILARQQRFADHADGIADFIGRGEVVVAHNASFDLRFIDGEFARLNRPIRPASVYCTMRAHRDRHGGGSGLDAVARHFGLARTGARHGALEDAWLALMIYLHQHGLALGGTYPWAGKDHPTNARPG